MDDTDPRITQRVQIVFAFVGGSVVDNQEFEILERLRQYAFNRCFQKGHSIVSRHHYADLIDHVPESDPVARIVTLRA